MGNCKCLKCICSTCGKIDTCEYHFACSSDNCQVWKPFVDDCKDYEYSKEIDDYMHS